MNRQTTNAFLQQVQTGLAKMTALANASRENGN